MEKEKSLHALKAQLFETLESEWSEHEGEDDDTQCDWIDEHVDGIIPVYTAELLEVASNDLWLAVDVPERLAFSGETTAVSCIAGNIYCHLQQLGQEWLIAKRV